LIWQDEIVGKGRKAVIHCGLGRYDNLEYFITRYKLDQGVYWEKEYEVWMVDDDKKEAVALAEKWVNGH
jgi:hypothetical protein